MIAPLYQKDTYHWVHALHEALARYQSLLQSDRSFFYSPSAKELALEQDLKSLTHDANNMVRLLTEDGKKELIAALADHQTLAA